ncbi:MAG: hypothetical protein ABL877_00645 [Thiobacillus sp.]
MRYPDLAGWVRANINLNDESIMQSEHFDLNDIQHEPTDAQLKALMNSVAVEAKRRAELARAALMQRLRDDIAAANHSRSVA